MSGTLTDPARAVVIDAVARASLERAYAVRADHLLTAIMAAPSAHHLLSELDLLSQSDAITAEIERGRRRAGLSALDASALAEVGIDLDTVVDRAEIELGAGALDESRRHRRRILPVPRISGGMKDALRGAQRQAAARGDQDLTVDHLLLGLLTQQGLVADTLATLGCTVATALEVMSRRSTGGRS